MFEAIIHPAAPKSYLPGKKNQDRYGNPHEKEGFPQNQPPQKQGKERLEYYMAEIRKKGDAASKKDQDTLKCGTEKYGRMRE